MLGLGVRAWSRVRGSNVRARGSRVRGSNVRARGQGLE